jgi:hypothetical protein
MQLLAQVFGSSRPFLVLEIVSITRKGQFGQTCASLGDVLSLLRWKRSVLGNIACLRPIAYFYVSSEPQFMRERYFWFE